MSTATTSQLDRVWERLGRLADHPWLLFLILFTVNALARPYAGFAHDARLYGVQVLNQVEPGSFADDLFLKFGSQDSFSVFSRAAAPLASALGLEAAFFLLYLASNGLFLLALQRLFLALLSDRTIAVLALLYAAVAPLPFGGLNVFHVHEPFLTPRIVANACVLLGLERLLVGRRTQSLLLMLAALIMHPLMASGGLIVWLLATAHDALPRRVFFAAIGLATIAAAGVLLHPPAALSLFGYMDASWRDIVRGASPYNFPDEWSVRDWLTVAAGLLILVAAARTMNEANKSRLLGIIAFTAAAGLVGTAVGAATPYAFLFQAQPYRAQWIVRALEPACAFWLIQRLWRCNEAIARLGAVLLIAFYFATSTQLLELALPLLFLPILVVRFRGLDGEPRRPDWLPRSLLYSLVLGACAWAAYKMVLIVRGAGELAALIDGLDFVRLLLDNAGPLVWLLAATALAAFVLAPSSAGRRPAIVLALALAVQVVFFVVPNLALYRQSTRHQHDLARLGDVIDSRHHAAARPTIYCSLGRIDLVWIDLRANSYFDWAQVVGCLFSRGNAEEGQRRAIMVRAFEIDRFREGNRFLSDATRRTVERLFQVDFDSCLPTRADLERLCLDESIDYVILKQEFPELAAASSGSVHLYDCRQVRLAFRTRAVEPIAAADGAASPDAPPLLLTREVTTR